MPATEVRDRGPGASRVEKISWDRFSGDCANNISMLFFPVSISLLISSFALPLTLFLILFCHIVLSFVTFFLFPFPSILRSILFISFYFKSFSLFNFISFILRSFFRFSLSVNNFFYSTNNQLSKMNKMSRANI